MYKRQLRNASLAHIEHGGCVELAHRGTVGTLHVIGVNLQHGLGEHAGRLGGTQILVGHLRLGLLTVVANMDQSSESTNGPVSYTHLEYGAVRPKLLSGTALVSRTYHLHGVEGSSLLVFLLIDFAVAKYL